MSIHVLSETHRTKKNRDDAYNDNDDDDCDEDDDDDD